MSEVLKNAVVKFIALRDKKKLIEAGHKEELKPLNDAMSRLENAVQKILLSQGAKNFSTTEGTAYLSTTIKAKVEDWEVFKEYALENDLFDMLEHRVSKDAVEEFQEAQGELPPGISISSEVNTRFKR